MIGHFLGGKTAGDVANSMTWPELQALIEHWKYEPPMPWLLARYFEIEPRPVEAGQMPQEEAETLFNMLAAEYGSAGRVFEQ